MSSNINIRDFLHDILANKARAKLTISQFEQILGMADEIQKISQKGLLIITLADQLHKLSNVNYVTIKKFMNEFIGGLKPERPRREREQRQRQQRRRRQVPADTTHVTRNLQKMAQQSVSNPSNVQLVRIGQGALSKQSQSVKLSQDASKRSDPNKRDFDFANQLNQISQGFQYITGQQFEHQHQENVEQLSRASSSSNSSFGIVSNLSQKMDLLKHRQRGQDDQKGQKKTKVAKRTVVEATMTKKKASRIHLVDQMLTLQKTRATLNESITMDQRSISFEYTPWIDPYQNELFILEEVYEDYLKTLKQTSLQTLQNVMLSARKFQGRQDEFQNVNGDFTQFETQFQGQTMYDFTSQPIPELSDNLQINQINISQLSIFNYQNANPRLAQISAKANKPYTLVFYEMLDKMQKGEVVMTQYNSQQFGEIRVELLPQKD